jgi:hypothetical protein
MSDHHHFTDGNLIILYAIHRRKNTNSELPDYVKERIKVCIDTFKITVRSKPDKHKTMIVVFSNGETADNIRTELIKAGIDHTTITVDSIPKNIAHTFDRILNMIKTRINPPYMYFIGSVWQRDIYDSIISSKLKGYMIHFEGAPDNRPIDEVEEDKKIDIPRKGMVYYKKKAKDKAIDMLLNRMFHENDKG